MVEDTRAARLRALRHLPTGAVSVEDADRIAAQILHEVPALAHDETPARLIGYLLAGDAVMQIAVILGGTARRRPRRSIGGLLVLVSLPIVMLTCVVLAIMGSFATIGVVITTWFAGMWVVGKLGAMRWGCLPRRHAKLVDEFCTDGATESAWVHYRAVRGIALDDEAAMTAWAEALTSIAAIRYDGERMGALRHDCSMLEAVGGWSQRESARRAAKQLGLGEVIQWRM